MIWILLSKDLGFLLYFKNNCVLFVYILLTQLDPLINKLNINITIIVEIESKFSISLRKKNSFKNFLKEKMWSIVIKNHEFGSRDVI
jgi:predicted metallopeptidase